MSSNVDDMLNGCDEPSASTILGRQGRPWYFQVLRQGIFRQEENIGTRPMVASRIISSLSKHTSLHLPQVTR